jgi:hypothetical protein
MKALGFQPALRGSAESSQASVTFTFTHLFSNLDLRPPQVTNWHWDVDEILPNVLCICVPPN